VDQARERALPAPLVHRREQGDDVVLPADVRLERDRVAADLARHRLRPRAICAVGDGHRVAALGRQPGGRRADAARAPGDDDGSVHGPDANRRQPRPGSAPPFTWITWAVTWAAAAEAR